ncbi:MAG TPA: hypothetical protein VKD25_09890 [Burkholderiales bacterium]|nr:hypothetical protein [Burkholderiales bacterium]
MNRSICWLLGAAALAGAASETRASCGAAFCMVNTSWNVQGAWTEPGARFDLRFEYIDQDQPRAGSDKVAVGQIPQHHDEVRTINRNWLATFDYTFNPQWGVSATLPVVDRSHEHIHNHMGQQLLETWNFTKLGDVRVVGRRQWQSESREAQRLDFFGVNFGLKLPTGDTDVRNDDGDLAERSLQPGTGTTDLILGAYYTRMLGSGSSWFADLQAQQALNSFENYKPGLRVGFDVGYRWATTERLTLMLQLNALYKDRDKGSEAEPEDSGGKFVFVSPGLSYVIVKNLQLFGFVQLPIYQYVNGVQLTADWAAVAGMSVRF